MRTPNRTIKLLLTQQVELIVTFKRDAGLHRAEQTAHVPIAECDDKATAIAGDVAEVVVLFEEHKVELDSRAEEIQLLGISQLCCRSVDLQGKKGLEGTVIKGSNDLCSNQS